MSLIAEASRLIGIALNPKAKPGGSGASELYAELLARYLEEVDFKTAVDDIAEGLGIQILDAESTRGLLCVTKIDSPFQMVSQDFSGGMTGPQRALYGLIMIAIAATFYPNPVDLDETHHEPKRSIADIKDLLERVSKAAASEKEGEVVPSNRNVWRIAHLYQKLADTKPNERAGSTTREGMIRKALEEMERGGLVRPFDESETWLATSRLRIRLRAGAGNDIVSAVRAAGNAATSLTKI